MINGFSSLLIMNSVDVYTLLYGFTIPTFCYLNIAWPSNCNACPCKLETLTMIGEARSSMHGTCGMQLKLAWMLWINISQLKLCNAFIEQ